jgi:hypothetical protein
MRVNQFCYKFPEVLIFAMSDEMFCLYMPVGLFNFVIQTPLLITDKFVLYIHSIVMNKLILFSV